MEKGWRKFGSALQGHLSRSRMSNAGHRTESCIAYAICLVAMSCQNNQEMAAN